MMLDPDYPAHRLEIRDESRAASSWDPSPFDRVAFARHVLSLLRPGKLTVALYSRNGSFYVDRVRDLRHGVDAAWASVGIPSGASRAEIVCVLVELAGRAPAPFLVDLLTRSVPDG